MLAIDSRQRVVRINATGRRLVRAQVAVPFPLDHLPRERVLRDAIAGALGGQVTEAAEAVVDGRTLAFTS